MKNTGGSKDRASYSPFYAGIQYGKNDNNGEERRRCRVSSIINISGSHW